MLWFNLAKDSTRSPGCTHRVRGRLVYRSLSIMALLCCTTVAPAQGQTLEYQDALKHTAALSVADHMCAEYSVDMDMVSAIVSQLDIERDPDKTYFFARIMDTESDINRHGESYECEKLYEIYGPSGTLGATFMVKK